MHPAFSVIIFTTLAGAAQGLVVTLAVARLLQGELPRGFLLASLSVALVLLLVSLVASSFHLGRPERAWRAVLMWRTSWLSREVIVLPAFIGIVALWLALEWSGALPGLLPAVMLLAIALALALWLCTAMIYACLKFIEEWAHPLTVVNYLLLGLASGLLLTAALATLAGATGAALHAGAWALGMTLLAALMRGAALVRNAGIRHRSTLQSATGIRGANLRQTSMGMSAGAFNTREFFHGKPLWMLQRIKHAFLLLAFALPVLLMALALGSREPAWLLPALAIQYVGLLAERWFFFAQAKHPQNLYYQVVS
jgi:sulfite dehydrogenase (quinone) subunit SoeC